MDWDVWFAQEDFSQWESEMQPDRRLNAVQGIALGCVIGALMWAVLIVSVA